MLEKFLLNLKTYLRFFRFFLKIIKFIIFLFGFFLGIDITICFSDSISNNNEDNNVLISKITKEDDNDENS